MRNRDDGKGCESSPIALGTPALHWVGRAGHGRRAGKRPQGTAKCLTLTERRLSFDFEEVTPRPEGQALRRPWGGPIESALILSPIDFVEMLCIR